MKWLSMPTLTELFGEAQAMRLCELVDWRSFHVPGRNNPLIAEHGSRYSWSEPTMRRMMCGTISPTKPSIPATLTADAASMGGTVTRFPNRDEIDVPVNEQAIVELYSR